MESRYVFRSLEDEIGRPLGTEVHPHTRLTRRLRANYRELRDYTRLRETELYTLSGLAGNPGIDAERMANELNDRLGGLRELIFPYFKPVEPKRTKPTEGQFDRYFKILEEMNKKNREANNKEEKEEKDKEHIVSTGIHTLPSEKTDASEDGIMVIKR